MHECWEEHEICHERSTLALRGVLGHNAAKSCRVMNTLQCWNNLTMKKKISGINTIPDYNKKRRKPIVGHVERADELSARMVWHWGHIPFHCSSCSSSWTCENFHFSSFSFSTSVLIHHNSSSSSTCGHLFCGTFFLHCNPSPRAHGHISTAAATRRLTPESALGLNELEIIYSTTNVSEGFIEWFWFKWIMLVNKALMMTIVINPNFIFFYSNIKKKAKDVERRGSKGCGT